jgi:hypothetical protein
VRGVARRLELRVAARGLGATFAALFSLGDALGLSELVDDEVIRRSLHDVLDLLVLVPGCDHEPVGLLMRIVIFGAADIESRAAAVIAALAEDLEPVVGSASELLADALDLEVDRPEHRLVSGDALLSSVHSGSLWPSRGSRLASGVKLLGEGDAVILLEDDSAGQLMIRLDQVLP